MAPKKKTAKPPLDPIAEAKAQLEGDPAFIGAIEKRMEAKFSSGLLPLVQNALVEAQDVNKTSAKLAKSLGKIRAHYRAGHQL